MIPGNQRPKTQSQRLYTLPSVHHPLAVRCSVNRGPWYSMVKPVCWFRGWLGCAHDNVGAHNRTASRSDTLFHHKVVVPTNLTTAVEQHTNWLPELANEARMAAATGVNQTVIHPSVARFPVPPPYKMGPVATCAACAPYRLESLSSWSFRSPYELHKHFSAEVLQRQELDDVLSPRRADLLNSLDSQLLHRCDVPRCCLGFSLPPTIRTQHGVHTRVRALRRGPTQHKKGPWVMASSHPDLLVPTAEAAREPQDV